MRAVRADDRSISVVSPATAASVQACLRPIDDRSGQLLNDQDDLALENARSSSPAGGTPGGGSIALLDEVACR
jgi:hypothetical protein